MEKKNLVRDNLPKVNQLKQVNGKGLEVGAGTALPPDLLVCLSFQELPQHT